MKATSRLLVTGFLALMLTAPRAAEAGSIWAKANRRAGALHSDDTAKNVGDTLTIVIKEQSKIENETKRELKKDSSRDASITSKLDIVKALDEATGKLFNLPKLRFSSSGKTKLDGTADYESDRSLIDQITVTVEDRMPNGNLVVLGKRTREIAGDKQIIEVSGIVRPSDITFSNTIRSDQVASFHIVFREEGIDKRYTRPGWLARIFNVLSPY